MDKSKDDVFWAWLAGFFDGEGSIEMKRKSKVIRLYQSGKKGEIVMNYIQNKIGGTVRRYDPPIPKYMPYPTQERWRWWICNIDGCTNVLQKMLPYLIVKRDDAIAFIEMVTKNPRPKRTWTSEEEKIVKLHYRKIPARQIAKLINRTKFAVFSRARKMGI